MLTKVYFVRHAQPKHDYNDDRTRPLTQEGLIDSAMVFDFFKDKSIDQFYCSPYKRSIDTIKKTAAFFNKEIQLDERLREREKGEGRNEYGMFQKRWADHDYHEKNGESITMVQARNIEALKEILKNNDGMNILTPIMLLLMPAQRNETNAPILSFRFWLSSSKMLFPHTSKAMQNFKKKLIAWKEKSKSIPKPWRILQRR